MGNEKVWRGEGYFWSITNLWYPPTAMQFGTPLEKIVTLPAADFDAMKARVAEIERLRNHKPETPDDERSWIPYLLDAKARIATLEAEVATAKIDSDNYHNMCRRIWSQVKPREGLACDVILAQDLATAKADALELANEVRRLDKMHLTHRLQPQILRKRAAAVTAALAKYPDVGNERSWE